jgi:hypothetical protein
MPSFLDRAYRNTDLNEFEAGRNFWLSRRGHGVCFLDRNLGLIGEELHKAADAFGSVDVTVGKEVGKPRGKTWIFIE